MPYADPQDPRGRAAKRSHYERNREDYIARAKEAKKALRDEVRRIKGETPCADCGQRYPYYVMQFDHLPGHEKVGNVNRLVTSGARKRVMDEIAKCDVVCANCHAIRTYERATRKPKF